jgi:hypothetical protein
MGLVTGFQPCWAIGFDVWPAHFDTLVYIDKRVEHYSSIPIV